MKTQFSILLNMPAALLLPFLILTLQPISGAVQSDSINWSTIAGGGTIWWAPATPGFTLQSTDTLSPTNWVNVSSGTVNSPSDRNLKRRFEPVDTREVLEKVAARPVERWEYKDDTSTRHMGPVAQDFFAAFHIGADDKHIATVDADGVALAAIQGLNQKVEELKTELTRREAENAELKQRLDALERIVHER